MTTLLRYTFFVFLCFASSAYAAEAQRPRIGLVLGGGGARGAAHVGVLEALEELRIPIDCVAGTSMGALVGGAYAAGVSPAHMKARIAATDWAEIFNDSPGKDAINLRRKRLDERFYSGLEFGVNGDGFSFREGAVAGEKLKLFFNELVGSNLGERSIESLPLPLSIIATDIGNGERIVLKYGSLTLAMRASMSVPGLLAPVNANGRKLIDGGLVDNVPVKEVRERCAGVVIAVDVGTPLLKPDEVTGVVGLATQVVNLLTNQNVVASLAALGPDDVLIQPDLEGLSAADFSRQFEAMKRGYEAARKALEKLRRYSLSKQDYALWQASLQRGKFSAPSVDEIRVAGMKRVNPEVVRKHLRVEAGQPLDTAKINEDLVRLYGEGDFQSIDYALTSERGKNILRVTPVEKPWGPDYLRFGVNLSSDFRDRASYNLRAVYQRTWLNPLGAEWLTTLQIGQENLFASDWYQPLNSRRDWFVEPAFSVSNRTNGLFIDSQRIADYRTREVKFAFDAGANLGTHGQVRAGWLDRRINSSVLTGFSDLLPGFSEHLGGPRFALALDTFDRLYFPTRGWALDINAFEAITGYGRQQPYSKVSAEWSSAYSLDKFTLETALGAGRSPKGVLPTFDAFSLGGAQRLAGFADNQILGDDYLLGRLTLYRKLYKPPYSFGTDVYLGASVETGRMQRRFTEPNLAGWQRSFGLYLAANTFLGPVYTGFAYAPGQKLRWYLFLGTP